MTTVLPDGQTSTYTSYVIVAGGHAASASSQGSQPTGVPGLQSGSPPQTARYGVELAALLGVAIGVAAMI